jgi:hypothetical protein
MLVYHRTNDSAATAILADGFRDGWYVLPPPVGELRGVAVSADFPVDDSEGAHGGAVVELTIPETLWAKYEWIEEDATWAQAMIPAGELNAHIATAWVLPDGEIDALEARRWEVFRPLFEH